MQNYVQKLQPLSVVVPNHIEVSPDTVPIAQPYLPRLCPRQGYVFMWHTTKELEPDLYPLSQAAKNEEQWFTTKDPEGIEKVLALVHEYDDEVIIGCLKSAGYLQGKPKGYIKAILDNAWSDLILTFGHKKIICPSSSYLEYVHLCMNQKKIQHWPYDKKIMHKYHFKRNDLYWVRDPTTIC